SVSRVCLSAPRRDGLSRPTGDEPAFREHVYNLRADVLLLRLYLRVKPKAAYYVHRETLRNPGGAELLSALQDDRATNVEIRKSSASSDTVTLCKYYKDRGDSLAPVQELPRDALGR